jgi:hypothetical protein
MEVKQQENFRQTFERALSESAGLMQARKATLELAISYRNVFSSLEGRGVLKHILIGLGIFNPLPANDPPALERHNIAMAFLGHLWIATNDEEKGAAIDALLNIPILSAKEAANVEG